MTASHEIKRHLLLGRKAMTNLDSILKNRDTTLPTKVHLIKAMVFPVVMYGCESRTIKKAECQRIDAFELWCWRRLLRVPWTARSNQSILKEISPELSHWKRPWCWERLKAEGGGDDRGWDCWMASWTQWTWVWVSSRHWWWTGKVGVLRSMESKSLTRLRDWTELNWGSPGVWLLLLSYPLNLYPFLGNLISLIGDYTNDPHNLLWSPSGVKDFSGIWMDCMCTQLCLTLCDPIGCSA